MTDITINRRILILCEGFTEYIYAKSLKMELPRLLQRSIAIEIFQQHKNDPKSLVIEANKKVKKAQKDRNPYSIVWLFFDNDKWPQLPEAFEIINKLNFKVAYSSICIEHWFILHFENCGRAFNSSEEALKYLQRLWPTYHKTRTNAYNELKNNLSLAIDRANIINKNQTTELNIHEKNPYFTIQDFIDFFEKLKK